MSIDWIPSSSVRPIHSKERGNHGLFPSTKVIGNIIEYESCLERDFFLICDHAPDVISFQHQPVTIPYIDEQEKDRHYTPDIYVEFKGGKKILFEIKYESEILENHEKYDERWNAASDWAKKRDITFIVITDQRIRTVRWYNVWFTLGSSKCAPNSSFISQLNNLIPSDGERYDQIGYTLAESTGLELTKAVQIICYAIYHGLVFIDSFSTRQISNDTMIRKITKSTKPFRPLWDELMINSTEKDIDHEIRTEFLVSPSNKLLRNPLEFTIPQKYEKQVKERLNYVMLWLKYPPDRRTTDWRQEFCIKYNVSQRAMYYWVNSYQKEGVEGLIPKSNQSGRRIQYNQISLELMEKARQYYLKPLITIRKAFHYLEQCCHDQQVPTPTESSFKRYLYTNSSAVDFAKKHGRSYLKANFTPSFASFQGAIMPLQVLQMDNTSFDVFPGDSEYRECLSTPYLTTAIDCYSRMITGCNLSFFPSSSQSVLDVLVQSILPKETYVKTYNTQQNWPIQGFPVLLLVDNGMDFRAQTVRDFCIKYDIILEYAPIRTPRYKAFIEQWFNILHNALVKEDISGVRPLLKIRLENPDLKPEIDAVLTLQEIETWLHQWIVDEYHFTNPYEDHAPAPFLRWQDYQNGRTNVLLPLPREPPTNPQEINLLYLATLERDHKVLSSEGVVWHHLKFNNKDLVRIYNSKGKMKVDMLINPKDVRCVWVIDPDTSKPIRVDLSHGWAQTIAKIHGDKPIHASAWNKEIKSLNQQLKHRITSYSYVKEKSRVNREELLKVAKENTKNQRKEKEKQLEITRKKAQLPFPQEKSNAMELCFDSNPVQDFHQFKTPCPVNIVIPPRNKNPFYGKSISSNSKKQEN